MYSRIDLCPIYEKHGKCVLDYFDSLDFRVTETSKTRFIGVLLFPFSFVNTNEEVKCMFDGVSQSVLLSVH